MALIPKLDFRSYNLNPQLQFYLKQIIDALNGAIAGIIKFTDLDFTASNLTSILTRNHNDLQNIQGGTGTDHQHITTAQATKVAALPDIGVATGTSLAATGAVSGATIKATTAAGYISSDGSTGLTGTLTTASLVGKTVTIKDGIITSIV